ncbi:MAG: serine hydrolase, partial [Bacteroidota bacterium]
MRAFLMLLLTIFLVQCKHAETSQKQEDMRLSVQDQELIDYVFKDSKANLPGESVMVIKSGEVLYANHFGLADVDTHTSVSDSTLFKINSLSKQFSAMALMILVHQEKLTYETKLTEVFPDFPKYGDHITMRHLLTHQSGLWSYYDFIEEGRTESLLNNEILERLKQKDTVHFFPGTEFRYGHTGYALIPLIVEKITGKTFPEFMRDEIFDPLEMHQTTIFLPEKNLPLRALGYSIEKDSVLLNDESAVSAILGSKGVCTTTADYFKWDQALYSDALIPKEVLEGAFYNWEDQKKTNTEGYGYGWHIRFDNGIKVLSHYGETTGFASQVNRVPGLQLTAVLFSNHITKDRNLMHKVNALTSIYSNYKIPMPIDIVMKKAIDEKGLAEGLKTYDALKNNSRYKIEQTTLSFLGALFYRSDRKEDAEGVYRKAIAEQPDYFGGYFGLARVQRDKGLKKEAIANYEKVLSLGTDEEGISDYVERQL